MADTEPGWAAPPLSTDDPAAVAAYRDGVAALVAGAPASRRLLALAVAADPGFFLGRVAVAVADAVDGAAYAPDAAASRLTRGERQHAEILGAAFGGDPGRATDLRREHLLEYPGDLLIVWLPAVLPHRS
jgi:hypothetical protein